MTDIFKDFTPEMMEEMSNGLELGESPSRNKLYRCVQTHTSQAEWTPDATPALWTEVALPGEIEVWKQPTGAHDAYRVGAQVHFPTKDDPVYENDVDYNVYAPNVTGWHEVI